MENLNNIMQELAQYTRLLEETNAIIDGLKDKIKSYMQDNNIDTITGNEHKASYKTVTSSWVDTTALKKDMPDIVARYTRTTETKRFTFA